MHQNVLFPLYKIGNGKFLYALSENIFFSPHKLEVGNPDAHITILDGKQT